MKNINKAKSKLQQICFVQLMYNLSLIREDSIQQKYVNASAELLWYDKVQSLSDKRYHSEKINCILFYITVSCLEEFLETKMKVL